jgi:hypothetical protein
MGLDAVIFCNCVERKRLKIPHPYPRLLYVRSNGSPEVRSKDPVKTAKHDEWVETPPCEHESMMLDGCSLGNMTFIQGVRDAIHSVVRRSPSTSCPVLLGRVLYCGTHTGDHLTIAQVRKLAMELRQFKKLDLKRTGISSSHRQAIKSVVVRLERLVNVSRKANKPIAF